MLSHKAGPIGIFDSGYGGLTVLNAIKRILPQYDYMYLGDNARAPYGPRSFEIVYQFTKQAVFRLFEEGCQLVILACNTASAKALRTIQQNDLPQWDKDRRVLGVIRPTAEAVGDITKTNHVGVLATQGTVQSKSYDIEINKLFPNISVSSTACPLWVPLVEYNEMNNIGADFFIEKQIKIALEKDNLIDTIILGCTHYPLLLSAIRRFCPQNITLIPQGEYVANSLKNYLLRHKDMEEKCTKGATTTYLTTENAEKFNKSAITFLQEEIKSKHIQLT